MDEIMEAERFSKELDKILSGRPVAADLDPELAKDLAFAAKLSALDYSKESLSKAPAKAKILAKAEENRLRGFLRRVGVRPLVLAAASLVLILSPFAMKWIASEEQSLLSMISGTASLSGEGGGGGTTFHFGTGSSPYENGNNNIAAGGAIGGAGDIALYAPAPNAKRGAFKKHGALSSSIGGRANAGDAFARTGSGLNAAPSEPIPMSAQPLPVDREGYSLIQENPFQKVADHPLSTFSIDVDAASYSNARRFLNGGTMPPEDAVRI